MKTGDVITYGDKQATLIKPMTPYDSQNHKQCWEIKIAGLPCTVYRWINDSPSTASLNETGDKKEAGQ